PPGTGADAIKILCGSEGTLAIVVGARLKLVEVPKATGLILLHFDHVLDALGATPAILKHRPAAVELVDRMILDAGRANPAFATRCDFLHGNPTALLIVEFHDDSAEKVASRIAGLVGDPEAMGSSTAGTKLLDSKRQADLWKLRTSGLGLLMSKPGDAQSHAFVEDTAVDPARLRDYIEEFSSILDREGVEAGYYAHASVGCIHVRPVLNLKSGADIERMRRIADAVSDLALKYGGAMTGEHGDGMVRSCWLEKMYGPDIMQAFKEVKRAFDPKGLLNPHKIVDPRPMTEHLRYGPSFQSMAVKTHLDFSTHGGMAGLAGMCSGVGQCRQRLVGTMCPSYMATGDEVHTTRARANALRVALSNRGLLNGLDDPQLAEVMDLCLSCKACRTECPTGVDMARIKAEYLSRRNLVEGVSARSRLIAELPNRLALAGWFPRVSNLVMQSGAWRYLIERRFGLDRRIAPPRLAHQTFRAWWRRHEKRRAAVQGRDGRFGRSRRLKPAAQGRGDVVYFVDTWTNFVTPQVGIAAVKLLEQAGFHVYCPPTSCCGRPAISQGMLSDAKELATQNVRRLAPFAASGVPIIGTEPSCILTLVDEYPQLVRSGAARLIAEGTFMIETFLLRVLKEDPSALRFDPGQTPLLYHGHCHQKALVGTEDAVGLLRMAWGETASEINSGCCGMAGAFGHEVEHYDVAQAIGEQRLFPAIRDRGDAVVAVSGFSCRHQIEHHTGLQPRHVVEYLAQRLPTL
ncbi:MAG: 4Fe-4S dicluster domain-containing protein, partial [Planctomycetes bacterium]|nr:4Fe-4S dicluster domain-containing protein [Planctomycetota bacterium]